ncbi:MAG: hypothetical protein IJB00_06060 [Akkermansia sp.]|nr:hypothetical protein [Akkermansia sp.]
MKTTLISTLVMITLSGLMPLGAQQTPATAAVQSLPAPTLHSIIGSYYSMDAGNRLWVDFPVPVAAESEVGREVRPGVVRVSHAAAVRTRWLSSSRLEVEIMQDLPPMQVFRLEVPAGLVGLNGERLSGFVKLLPTSRGTIWDVTRCEDGKLIIRAGDDEDAKVLESMLPNMYYESGGVRRVPYFRPATVGDALADWDVFNDAFHYNLSDELRKEAAERSPDELLKHTWIVEAPALSSEETPISVMLPNAVWSDEEEQYTDARIHTIALPEFSYVLTNRCISRGEYEAELSMNAPAAATEPEPLLTQFEWAVAPVEGKENDWQNLEWREGTLCGQLQGRDIVITPGELKTATLLLSDGRRVTGAESLRMKVQTGGLELRLRIKGGYRGIVPQPEQKPRKNAEDVTVLRPLKPYVYTDVNADLLQMRGSTTIRCRYGRVTGGRIRVLKLSSEGADVARLLSEYERLYTGTHLPYWESEKRRETRREAGLDEKNPAHHLLSADSLPGVIATAERELPAAEAGEVQLPLAELFPGQPVGGFYMVEVVGHPLRESKYPCVNQGLVQVTDLGVLWKTDGRRLFAWAYRLSTVKEVEKGRLQLLDGSGKQLAELAVSNGIAEGELPVATRFLRLVAGDDRVTVPYRVDNAEEDAGWGQHWQHRKLMQAGVSPASLPTPLVYLFSDRSLYRPGETAHIKGIMRWVTNNQLSIPEVESITAVVKLNYEKVCSLPVDVQTDGTFTLDVPTDAVGNYRVELAINYKGDKDETSPDSAVLKGKMAEGIHLPRKHYIDISCKEFRRNEFEVKSSMNVQEKERTVTVNASATNFNTTPVAGGEVNWSLKTTPVQFIPKQPQWRDFRFGSYCAEPWSYYYAYYRGEEAAGESDYTSRSSKLDAAGTGCMSFTLPQPPVPACLHLVSTATVTNGNAQSIRSVQEHRLHPADVYGGIRPGAVLAKSGGTLPVELVAVKPDGSAWDGAPLAAEIRVKRTVFRPYRYGSFFASSVRNAEEETTEHTIAVELTGVPQKMEIPADAAGCYDIELRGKDVGGREFYSATRHYVWGDDVSPWEYMNGSGLELLPDREMYRPGETAELLVQTPVDAELLVTVERGNVMRHFRQAVTVANPVIKVPLEAGDAPVVYVSVSLVQNGGNRTADGKPLLKLGTCRLLLDSPDKKLGVSLDVPQESLLPGDECRVSGVVTDAAGKPVSNADVTLYAEDEGTLQVMGYRLPDPLHYFHSETGRDHGVQTHSALGQLVSENLGRRYFGNKGVFIGGGDWEPEDDAVSDAAADYLRKNFNPCALWLGSVRTDAQGRFSAVYSNPDTLTRYRVMAVASAGDKFGSGESAYHVTKPVMLEPAAPLSAASGDEVLLPVTLSMLPEELPEAANGAALQWLVKLTGSNAELPQPEQTVTLSGNAPVTVHFPVNVKAPGTVSLRWSVQAVSAPQGSVLARSRDAVELSFEAVPPTPYIREHFSYTLAPGAVAGLRDWVRGDYRAESMVELLFSTSPLAGIEYPLQYLFTYPYGCSEQLCSTVLPWVLREELQTALGIHFPQGKKPEAILAEVDARLESRRLPSGGYRYWDGAAAESADFSPYVVLVRNLMGKRVRQDINYLRRCVREGKGNDYLSLLVLALLNSADADAPDVLLQRAQHRRFPLSARQRWTLAVSAALLRHPKAAELLKAAQASRESGAGDYCLPPLRALQCLHAIVTDAASPATAAAVRAYVMEEVGNHSTWRSGWMVLTAGMYAARSGQADISAQLNGEKVTAAEPLRYSLTAGSSDTRFQATENPVYVYGRAEGYLTDRQPEQVVDRGFAVQRHYECLQPDGTWKPTAVFRVGDVVRVSLSARATGRHLNLRYLVLEDRLPAAFEAVDPQLSSQSLPTGISSEQYQSWWNFGSSVSNREFLKDRVRVFFDNWGNRGKAEVSYVARVVRSGKVTAPAAKAELMYQPEVHGLSIPQQIEVKPR